MKINSVNNLGNIKFQNNLNSQYRNIKAEKGDVVSFSASLPGAHRVEHVQKKYKDSISKLRAERKTVFLKNNRAFFDEANKIGDFNDAYSRFLKGSIKFFDPIDDFKQTSEYQALKIVDFFRRHLIAMSAPAEEHYFLPNSIAIVSEDKKKTNEFIEAVIYNLKGEKVLPVQEDIDAIKYIKEDARKVLVDFVKVPDKFSNVDDLQQGIYDALMEAEEKYKKSGIRTLLHVENIEPAISNSNSKPNIACMKDMLSSAWEDFSTVVVFGIKDRKNYDPGVMATHRVNYSFDLDKLGINYNDIAELNMGRKTLEPMFDRLAPVYRTNYDNYFEMGDKIKVLQGKCRKETRAVIKELKATPIQKLKKEFKNNGDEIVENGLSSLKKLKGPLGIGIAAAVAFGAGACLTYKKYVKNKAEQIAATQNQPAQQPINNVQKTTVNVPVQKTSNVFSEFQKIG